MEMSLADSWNNRFRWKTGDVISLLAEFTTRFHKNEIVWLNTTLNYLKMGHVVEYRIPGLQSNS